MKTNKNLNSIYSQFIYTGIYKGILEYIREENGVYFCCEN